MFNNEQDFEEWRVDYLNKAKEILTMDKEKENNRSKKIETTANWLSPLFFCVIQFDNINANDTMSSITVRIQTEIIILKIIFGLINLLCK